MAKSRDDFEATKRLMRALVRMPPKPHEEMKIRRTNGKKKKKAPPKRG